MGISINLSSNFLSNSSDDFSVNSNNKNTERYALLAQSAGLSAEDYYIYDTAGNVTGIDTDKLNEDIRNANKEKTDYETDSFQASETVRETEQEQEQEQEQTDASYEQSDIDAEYRDALRQYSAIILETQNQDVQDEWDSIAEEEHKLTSVTASNTTILEGTKEFINHLTKAIRNAETDSTNEDIEEEQQSENQFVLSEIEETTNEAASFNFFFGSAYDTTNVEEETAVEA